MPMIVADGDLIFFVHVPKAGGSSIEDYLVRRFGGPLSMYDTQNRFELRQRGVVSPPNHLTAQDLEELLPSNIAYCFAQVRNPLQRTLSQYRWQAGRSRVSHLSFSTWLRIVLRCARLDGRAYHNHIRPQTDFVPADCDVFRIEDGFEPLVRRLDGVLGSSAPEVEVGHMLKSAPTPTTVHRQDVEAIHDFYRSDYERFGYEFEDVSQFDHDRFALARDALAGLISPGIVWRQRYRMMI
jgi:hypothetical protein